MEQLSHRYDTGDIVHLVADPERSGPIVDLLPPVDGEPRYRVFHDAEDVQEYYEHQLQEKGRKSKETARREAIRNEEWLPPEEFRARLASVRLENPESNSLYSLWSGRIKTIPFQFKPLLRILRSDQPRLLIADEVGVGKTIEAGLILRELQARQNLENVLVVCPNALTSKWRAEMRRFDEDFRVLTSQSLSYCLRETHLDGYWPREYSNAIVNLELLRREEHLLGEGDRNRHPGLVNLDPPSRFDAVIIDEAHHVRNPETLSHEVARYLSDVSEVMLLLTATPVHLGSEDLFNLLNLLRPDLFPDLSTFEQVIEPNEHISAASRAIRAYGQDEKQHQKAASHLQKAGATAWGRTALESDSRYSRWLERLREEDPLTDEEQVRCLRDIEELHSLSHVLNRTRRRDIGQFTIREPKTISVPLTDDQEEFYDAVVQFRRKVLRRDYDPQVVKLITDTLERQATSCLPALTENLSRFATTGSISQSPVTDVPEAERNPTIPEELEDQADRLHQLADQLPDEDPKLQRLLSIIQETMESEGPGKLLIFSYFLPTISYLERELQDRGFEVGVVTGDVDEEDRETLRARFRLPRDDPDSIDLLLSSEVGTEGLDYEFCDRLVNYDIPWNPMRLEQRIGRIDRFGQQSEKVLIYNFITPGTVEERIFYRCYERIGIFRDTIGDLDEILGDIVTDLNELAADPSLTPEQAERKAEQLAQNSLREIEEQRRLEESARELLAFDHLVDADIEDIADEGRFISPRDLKDLIQTFIDSEELDGELTTHPEHSTIDLLDLSGNAKQTVLEKLRDSDQRGRAASKLRAWLKQKDGPFTVTFDQETALERRDIAFITPLHPLARIAAEEILQRPGWLISHLSATAEDAPEGQYAFSCDLWETIGATEETRLVPHVWDIDDQQRAPRVERKLLSLLREADAREESGDPEVLIEALDPLDELALERRTEALAELEEHNETLIERRIASLSGHYESRIERVSTELDQASDDRIKRMKESELERLKAELSEKEEALEEQRSPDIVSRRVAAGLLEIQHPEGG